MNAAITSRAGQRVPCRWFRSMRRLAIMTRAATNRSATRTAPCGSQIQRGDLQSPGAAGELLQLGHLSHAQRHGVHRARLRAVGRRFGSYRRLRHWDAGRRLLLGGIAGKTALLREHAGAPPARTQDAAAVSGSAGGESRGTAPLPHVIRAGPATALRAARKLPPAPCWCARRTIEHASHSGPDFRTKEDPRIKRAREESAPNRVRASASG